MDPIETSALYKIIGKALYQGYKITVDTGGEDYDLANSTDDESIFNAATACGWAKLIFRGPGHKVIGWAIVVFGNGEDLVTDYSGDLEWVLS